MSKRKEEREEVAAKSGKVISLIYVNVFIGKVWLDKLTEFVGGKIIYHVEKDRENNCWRIMGYREKADSLLKRILVFFRENDLPEARGDGTSRVVCPFKDIFTEKMAKRLKLEATSLGYIFRSTVRDTLDTIRFSGPLENRPYVPFDEKVKNVLVSHSNQKQIPVKKWLELTEPNPKTKLG